MKKVRKTTQVSKSLFKYALRLPYRQTEGFVRTLFRQMGISIELPNFRTIHYRHKREEFHFDHLPDDPKDLPQGFVIVLDSTGMKWLSKKHGNKRKKGWIKVHVAIDISSSRVLDMKVTDN
ncbi:MAG: transposase, partial [Aquificaceae bacterium]|nr:transposase [Aquificaceae bacterium]